MTKTSLFKKCILTIATFSVSLLFAVLFMITPAVAYAEIVSNVNGFNSTFDSSISDFTIINDSSADNEIDLAYTVTHRSGYKQVQFGALPEGLDNAHSDFGYAIIKTSPSADNQNIGVAAGLATESATFYKDSFYRISVDVNAQSQSNYGGAVIKLDGETDYYFMNGNNKFIVTKDGQWSKYTFYLATSQFDDLSVSISLTLGDIGGTKCIGYAAFDNLEVDRIDFATFNSALITSANNPTSFVEDLRKTPVTNVEDFNSASYETEGDIYTYTESIDGPNSNKIDGNQSIAIANREEGVSSYGVVSINKDQPITFKQVTSTDSGFYILMVRTKAKDDFTGTASVTLNYKSTQSYAEGYKTFSIGAINELPNESHNNWKTNYFIIKSSVISDVIGYISVEYGSESSLCRGTILIDDIEILQINFADYSNYAANLTTASVDCDLDAQLKDSTGVNGAFYKLRTDRTDVLLPDLWAITTTSNDVDYKLVDKDTIGYNINEAKFGIDSNNPIGNVLKIASTTNTNFAIDSQVVDISATDDVSYYKINVLLASKNLTKDGATLSLVDTNGTPYGAIKLSGNIAPTLYSFNIKAKNSASFYVRIAMGDNTQGNKIAGKGELYIARINYVKSNETEYKESNDNCATINFYYDNFNDFTSYNKYDEDYVKDAYSFIGTAQNNSTGTMKHGIVEIGEVNVEGHPMASTARSYGLYNNPNLDPYLFGGERLNKTYAFRVDNSNATLTLNETFTLSLPAGDDTDKDTNASTYYKVVVSARSIVSGEHPLTIGLKTVEGEVISTISNIKDTRVYDDDGQNIIRDQFVDFEFFVKLNDKNVTLQIFMTFGGEKNNEKTTGFVLFQGFELLPTYETAYENAINNTKDGSFFFDNTTETYKYATTSDLSVEKESGETTEGTTYNPNDTWFLLPSILFAVLIIVAIAGYFIKKLVEKIKDKKEKEAPAKNAKKPGYATRIDYSAIDKEENGEVADETPAQNGTLEDFDEEYDMYAVHEVVDPTKLPKTEEIEPTEEPVIEEIKQTEEKKEEVNEVKVESDEFDD